MKKLLLVSLLSFAPLVSSASNIYCTSLAEGQPPTSNSYAITVASDSKSAYLQLPSGDDYWSSRTLRCRDVRDYVPGIPSGPRRPARREPELQGSLTPFL